MLTQVLQRGVSEERCGQERGVFLSPAYYPAAVAREKTPDIFSKSRHFKNRVCTTNSNAADFHAHQPYTTNEHE